MSTKQIVFNISNSIWTQPSTYTGPTFTDKRHYDGNISVYPTLTQSCVLQHNTYTAFLASVSNGTLTPYNITMSDNNFTITVNTNDVVYVCCFMNVSSTLDFLGVINEQSGYELPVPYKLVLPDESDHILLSPNILFTQPPVNDKYIVYTSQSIITYNIIEQTFETICVQQIKQTNNILLDGFNMFTTQPNLVININESTTLSHSIVFESYIPLIININNAISSNNDETITFVGKQPVGRIVVYDYSENIPINTSESSNYVVYIPAHKNALCMLGSHTAVQYNLQQIYDTMTSYILQDTTSGQNGVNVAAINSDIMTQLTNVIKESIGSGGGSDETTETVIQQTNAIYDYKLRLLSQGNASMVGPIVAEFKLPTKSDQTLQTSITGYVMFNSLTPDKNMFYMYYGKKYTVADGKNYIIFSQSPTLSEVNTHSDNIYISPDGESSPGDDLLSIQLVKIDDNLKLLYNNTILPIITNCYQEDYNTKTNISLINIGDKVHCVFDFGEHVESLIIVDTTVLSQTVSVPELTDFETS